MKLKRTSIYTVALLLVFAVYTFSAQASAEKVLILHSYHPQLTWVRSINKGIRKYFEKENPSAQLRFEYMDTKRITDPYYFQILYELYKYKFTGIKFDVIICSDNNGLNFLLKYHDLLFPRTPVVFCGINNFNDAMIAGKKWYTGVVEKLSIKEILDVAIKFHPATKEVFFYGDNSTTYYANKALVERVADDYKPGLAFHFIDNISIEQIQDQIRHLGPDSMVLLGSTLRDKSGALLSFEKSASMLEEVSSVPIYGFWDFYLGHGIVGGKLVSGFYQGKTAAEMADRILGGEAVANIPVVRQSPNKYMFDNNQLKKFHIDSSRLPPNSTVINGLFSYYEGHRLLIIAGICFAMLLMIVNILLILNIRNRRRAEKQLRESEKLYRNLLESTSTVPWELDVASGKFSFMGKQIEQMLGYSVESWTDLELWASRIYHEDKKDVVAYCKIETEKGNDHDIIYRAIHMDGSYRWIRDIVSVVSNDDGTKRLIGFMHDITKQKNLSLEKKKLESRLVQAQKMEAIGTLAGGIAHDFNNILAAILGYTELALEEVPDGTQYGDDLGKVLVAANRAKDLIKQILTFSRHADVERIPLNIQPIIKEGLKMLRSSIPSTISITENIDSSTGVILADPTQVHQILINLCTNAYHAMEESGGALHVSLQDIFIGIDEVEVDLHINSGKYVQLTVNDTGVGMDADIIGRIFEPYFSTKDVGKGTGMGLAITHGIIENYGGTITVKSQPGKGTTFNVFFPVIKKAILPETKEIGDIPGGTERILFVDDETILAEMGKNLLERLGYQVTVEHNSLEALSFFQKNPNAFDLVITDQTMPDMTGFDLARRMMQIRPDIPIILCTGYSSSVDAESAINIGIKEFALKPLTKRDIAQRIRKALAGECEKTI